MSGSSNSHAARLQADISIIIPCFNDGATLEEAVASVLNQTTSCELIIIDDGSTDANTLAVFDRLAQKNIRIIHQENCGLPGARMTGVANSRGKYILPLDADDKLLPDALPVLQAALDNNPQAAFAYGDAQIFGNYHFIHTMPSQLDPWLITYYNTMPVVALFRRSVIDEIDGWQHDMGYEDWDMWMALAERQQWGVHTNRIVFAYRIRPDSLLSEARTRHHSIYASLCDRHQQLFIHRRQNMHSSSEKWFVKAGVVIISRLLRSDFAQALWITRITQFHTTQGWRRVVSAWQESRSAHRKLSPADKDC